MFGYIARETEKAVALVTLPLAQNHKPMWVPRKKIIAMEKTGDESSVQLAGEGVRRIVFGVNIEIDPEFLKKIGVA